MGIDFSDEGWKDQSAHFKGLIYKSQKSKTQPTARCNNYVALFRA
jgi:hypothetical protein